MRISELSHIHQQEMPDGLSHTVCSNTMDTGEDRVFDHRQNLWQLREEPFLIEIRKLFPLTSFHLSLN